MKLSTKEDIGAPIERVFAGLCDFEVFERQAMRRGAEVQRTDSLTQPGVGMGWNAAFTFRGRRRNLELSMIRFDAPNEMVVQAVSPSIAATFSVELLALSRNRTRLTIGLDMRPLNLSARLWIQSLKLAKGPLTKRFKLRVADYSKVLEERLARSA